MKITIDTDLLKDLSKTAGGIFLDPKGEETLVSLLKARDAIEEAIDDAKKVLEASAMTLDPNFSSLTADKVKVYYRSFGARWIPDMPMIQYLPTEYYDSEIKIKLDTKKIEKHIKDTGKIPAGVTEVERSKTITFSLKGDKVDE